MSVPEEFMAQLSRALTINDNIGFGEDVDADSTIKDAARRYLSLLEEIEG